MKKTINLFLCFCVIISIFSSCINSTPLVVDISSIQNSSYTESSDVTTSLDLTQYLPHTNYTSKWNTNLIQNHKNRGEFFYDNKKDSIYYCKDEIVNKKHVYSLVVRNNNKDKTIAELNADSIYVLDKTIFYSNELGIYSIQTDGSDKNAVLELSMDTPARYLFPYEDSLFYLSDEWEICQTILSDKTQKTLATAENVFYYMIYNDSIYYAGFSDELDGFSYSLRWYDLKTGKDIEIVSNIAAFDILNDNIYFFDEMCNVYSFDMNTKQQKLLFSDNSLVFDAIYITETNLLFFTLKDDGSHFLNKYNFNSKERDEICSIEYREWSVCGNYLCSYSPYDPDGQTYRFQKVF